MECAAPLWAHWLGMQCLLTFMLDYFCGSCW